MARRDDTPRVFDVSKPSRVSPDATSRPVIVGHHPMMSDPMVTERPHSHPSEPAKVTLVPVISEGETTSALQGSVPDPTGLIEHQPPSFSMPRLTDQPEAPETQPSSPDETKAVETPSELLNNFSAVPGTPLETSGSSALATETPSGSTDPSSPAAETMQYPTPAAVHEPHSPPVPPPNEPAPPPEPQVDTSHLAGSLTVAHAPGAGPQTGYWRKPLLSLVTIIILLVGYGIADAKTSLPLPFHPFRETKLPDSAPAATIIAPTPPPVTTPPAVADPYAGWKTYTDDFVALKYPVTWSVTRNDNTNLPGTKSLKIDGPSDAAIANSTQVVKGHKASLSLTIFKSLKASITCNCKVYDLLPLGMTQAKTAKLAAVSDTRLGGDPSTPAADLLVTNDAKAVKNKISKISDYLTINSQYVSLITTINDNDIPDIRIANLSAFEKSQSVQDLIKLINSISFK